MKILNNTGEKNFRTKKKYGQNFLENKVILEEIFSYADINKTDTVIEIGPGLGFLTESLAEKAGQVYAFEIDDDLVKILSEKFSKVENLKIIHTDFMDYDLSEIAEKEKNIKVVANIPYYITSPIVGKLIKYRDSIDEIYIMVQKEVAERISAVSPSSDISLLTHAVQFFGNAEYLFTVKKELFNPVPKVDSAFLGIKLYKDREYEKQIDEAEYFKYLKAAFSNKRKSLGNNMKNLGYDKQQTGSALEKTGKKPLARAEEFSVQEFIDFINALKDEK